MAELFPHQITGAEFLAQRGFAFLWDQFGTGKTPTAIEACNRVGARKILVVAPEVMRPTWADEFAAWWQHAADLPITICEGYVSAPPGDGVTVIGHSALADEAPSSIPKRKPKTKPKVERQPRTNFGLPNLQRGAPYDAIILDEAHNAFTGYDAARTRNFYAPGDGLWTGARRTWALTGTPLVNSAADLWPPMAGPLASTFDVTCPWYNRCQPFTAAPPWYDWCKAYTVMRPSMDGEKPTGIQNAAELAQILRPHTLRRTIQSLDIDLPPLTTNTIPIDLPPHQLFEVMHGLLPADRERVLRALEEGRELEDAAIGRVRHALGVAKAGYILQHMLSGRVRYPLVVFFHHTGVREAIHAYLSAHVPGMRVSWIDGTITRNQVRAAKEGFQDGRIDTLLVQIQAGGVGLTLTRSCHCLLAELPWTAVAKNQAIARIHRISQTLPCTADIFRVRGCWLEDLLANVIAKKQQASDQLLNLLTTNH